MRPVLTAAVAFAVLLFFCGFGAEQAWARVKKQDSSSAPDLTVDDTGTPIIMQGLRPAGRAVTGPRQPRKEPSKEAKRHVKIPRGSASFVPPISSVNPLPRTPLIGQAPATAPYNPPPVRNPSAEISQYNQSFQFNKGLNNNPTGRDAYIRYNFNR
jgi:hypothetical protein